jgi:hypothetical protein
VLVAWYKHRLGIPSVLIYPKSPWTVTDILFAYPASWADAFANPRIDKNLVAFLKTCD